MPDITISYKGETIATLDASGSTVLLTDGKYCEDDITITYVKAGSETKSIKSTKRTVTSNE